jgi:RNase P subunit RPR2
MLPIFRAYQTLKLKNRLIKEGFKKEICEKCNNDLWLGSKIPLELDHIDGNSSNHKFENLRMLCPNCHAQTDTYRGANKKS